MFSTAIQPSIVSLFSSTGTDPLALFSTQTDGSLPSDSYIHLLHDRLSHPPPSPPAVAVVPPPICAIRADDPDRSGYSLGQTVLHIQSPTLQSTYIQCPPDVKGRPPVMARDKSSDLGMKHPWLYLQVRNMGREWAFEVGLVDRSGRMGVLRLSTFQKQPRLKLSTKANPPLLHLPLSFPSSSSHLLTTWSTVALHLPTFLPYFSSPSLVAMKDGDTAEGQGARSTRTSMDSIVPGGAYSHASYVRVYATCRLRRIWFAEAGPSQRIPWELELYTDG